MKRNCRNILIFLFIFSASALLLTGCVEKAPEKADLHIDSSFYGNIGDLSVEGVLIYSETQQMYLDFSTPDELYGLSFSFGERFTVGYRGLNAEAACSYLPETSFAQSVKDVLDDALLTQPLLQSCGDGLFKASGKTDCTSYNIYTDSTGKIREIEIAQGKIKVVLKSFD